MCVSVIGLWFSIKRVFSFSQFIMGKTSFPWCVAYPFGQFSIVEFSLPRLSEFASAHVPFGVRRVKR